MADTPARKRRFTRQHLYLILILLFAIVVIAGWDEASTVAVVLLDAGPGFLALAVLAQGGYYLAQAGTYQALCQAVGLPYRYREILPVTVSWPFVSVTVPAAGLAGVALVTDDAHQRHMQAGRGVIAGILYFASLYIGFGVSIWGALFYLAGQGLLQPYQVIAGLAHFLWLAGVSLFLGMTGWAPLALRRTLEVLADLANRLARRFRRPLQVSAESIAPLGATLQDAVRQAARSWGRLSQAIFCTAVAQGFSLLSLWMVVRALVQQWSPIQMVAVYGISNLVTLVSPTPQGIGFTEEATVAIFSSMGSSFDGAVAITLAFRGVAFWLPFLAGLFVVRVLPTFRNGRRGAPRETPGDRPAPSQAEPSPDRVDYPPSSRRYTRYGSQRKA